MSIMNKNWGGVGKGWFVSMIKGVTFGEIREILIRTNVGMPLEGREEKGTTEKKVTFSERGGGDNHRTDVGSGRAGYLQLGDGGNQKGGINFQD